MFRHPDKWRDTCDLFSLDFHTFAPTEILGYPHAGNDVFHVKGIFRDKEITAYVKVARQKGAAIENEVNILQRLSLPYVPKLIDCDLGSPQFAVTAERPGERLSVIVGDNENGESLSYMEEYGAMLGYIHTLKPDAPYVADRRFFHPPQKELLDKLDVPSLKDYFAAPPANTATVFTHGDFHYANILWQNRRISGVLDFELSGYGNRDFDIAWALILRPGQKFLKTQEERELFLKGYRRYGEYDSLAVTYYMSQIYAYFYPIGADDPQYARYVRDFLITNARTH